MKKIQFKNNMNPALSEEILKALQDNIEEAIETKNVIKAYATSSQAATTNSKVNLQEYRQIGNLLSFENGGIRIGRGISYIRVYAQIFFEYLDPNQNYFWIRVQRNNDTVASKLTACAPREDFIQADVYGEPIPVSEGDLITLNFGDLAGKIPSTRGGENLTYLIVTAIKQHIE